MNLFRLHAYAVSPQKGAATIPDPDGGAITLSGELRSVINSNLTAAKFERRTAIDFDVNTTTRTNEVRDLITDYAFGQPATAKSAAIGLAKRLCAAMDHRSTPCLFIPAAFHADANTVVTLWTFPRDEALRFRQRKSGPTIQVLTDIFSQSSRLRKAAHFRGRNVRSHFMSGRALDFQAGHGTREIADFWILRFLQCRFGIAGDAGTRLLARVARAAYEVCDDSIDQEQLYTAILTMRRSPNKRLSLQDFADRYLSGGAHGAFLDAIPNSESRNAIFDFQTDVFDAAVQFRVFQLETGVFVSSPLKEIGQSVRINDQKANRTLACEGSIVDERLRKRHA